MIEILDESSLRQTDRQTVSLKLQEKFTVLVFYSIFNFELQLCEKIVHHFQIGNFWIYFLAERFFSLAIQYTP